MAEKTIEQHVEDINKKFSDFATLIESSAKQEDFDGLKTGLGEIKEQLTGKDEAEGVVVKLDNLIASVEAQGLEMRKITDNKPAIVKSLGEMLFDKKDDLINLQKAGQGKLSFEVKTDVTTASITDYTPDWRLPEIGQLPTQVNQLAPLFRQASLSGAFGGAIPYIDQLAATRNADWKAEAAQYPESAITWQRYSLPVEKVVDSIPGTLESLADTGFIESELRMLLDTNIRIKEDNGLWDGDGSTPNIKGCYTSGTEYVAAASGITDANIYDLIVKMIEAVVDTSKYIPNYAIMNIIDVNKMRLKKDSNNNYVVPPFVTQDGTEVAGVKIITSNSVTADTMLVGDFNFGTLYKVGGINIEIGWIDKQFIEDMVTFKASQREALLIKLVNAAAFAKETGIAAALVTLAT